MSWGFLLIKKNMINETENLRPGDLILIAFANVFVPGMYVTTSDTFKFRGLSWYNNTDHKFVDQMIAGERPLPSIDYLITWDPRRIVKISEDKLDEVEKKYLKFYRSKLPNEYKNNRPGNTF